MELNMNFINKLYIGKEILDDDKDFIMSAYKIFNIIKNSTEYKDYIEYLSELSGWLSGETIEELHFGVVSELDIIRAIVFKGITENDNEVIGIFNIRKTFIDLLLDQAIEIYPLSRANHKLFHNIMYGEKEPNAENIYAQLNIKPLGTNKKFIEEYMNYLPDSLLNKLDVHYTGARIKTILTIKNEDDEVLFQGPNDLKIVDDNGDTVFNAIINISKEDCSKYFKGTSSLGLLSESGLDASNPDKPGCKLPILGESLFGISFSEISEARKTMHNGRIKQIENEKNIIFSNNIPDIKMPDTNDVLSVSYSINLDIKISGHKVNDDGDILFIMDLGKTIKTDNGDINKLILVQYDPLDDAYEGFKYEEDIWFEVNESPDLNKIFLTEDDLYEAIKPYTIKYLKDNKLPRWYLSVDNIADHIICALEDSKEAELNHEYIEKCNFCKDKKETNYSFNIEIGNDYIRLYNHITDVKVLGDPKVTKTTENVVDKFVKEWNNNAEGKFDWSIYTEL